MKAVLKEIIQFTIVYSAIALLPYLLEECGEALERGRLNARREDRENERRIRSGITGSGSNVVKLHNVSAPSERGPESGA